MSGLKDPVERSAGKAAEKAELSALDIRNVDKEELSFKPIPPERARITRPFDGYPLKKFKHGQVETFTAFIVALNPTVPVIQDPANQKKFKTYHSRVIRDTETRENFIVMFDREIEIKGTVYQCAIVPSHNVRAQIVFKYDTTKKVPKIEVDRRYLLLDSDQDSRLKRVFEQVINPTIKMERDAAFITGESNTDTGEASHLEE